MKIIEKHDNYKDKYSNKEYLFVCPICGTIFTAKYDEITKPHIVYDAERGAPYEVPYFRICCPNCNQVSPYSSLDEYQNEI